MRRERFKIQTLPFHVMVKPIGPICNLQCDYCFYLHKSELYSQTSNFRMKDEVLEHFIQSYIQSQPGPEVSFVWQGGEPTLMGLDFFRKVVELQKRYIPPNWRYTNGIQTNGTLIDEEWARFFKDEQFLVGLSLDGPQPIHDLYRKDQQGQGTWQQVVDAFHLLQRYGVDVNILCVVNKENASQPLTTYEFMKELGVQYLQFIPLVEREVHGRISEKSVTGPLYGTFLINIFNQWILKDIGQVFIQIFEEALTIMAGLPAGLCVFRPECGRQLIMEHNGDIYSCDHYVLPENRLGNIMENSLESMVNSSFQRRFGKQKLELSQECSVCPVLTVCRGECPKNRIDGLNWLCSGYKQFFSYAEPFLAVILQALKQGLTAKQAQSTLIKMLDTTWDVKRNDSCPCLSGLKYKKCCGKPV